MWKQQLTNLKTTLAGIHLVPGAGCCGHSIWCGGSTVNIARLQEHVDHDVVQVGIGPADPLGYDEDAQVAKQGIQEDHLGHKLADDGQLVTEVAVVEEGQDHAHIHLRNTCRAHHRLLSWLLRKAFLQLLLMLCLFVL